MSNDFGGEFWIATITLILGSIGMCIKAILASKCSDTEICFGCLRIIRDTKVEEDIELATLNRNIVPNDIV